MQIISNRQVLFEKTRYEKEVIEGKETGRSVAIVEDKILVAGDVRPQVVPEWIKEDPHFDLLIEDGQIIEVTTTSKPVKPKGGLKGANTQAETSKAKFAGESESVATSTEAATETKAADATGWGAA